MVEQVDTLVSKASAHRGRVSSTLTSGKEGLDGKIKRRLTQKNGSKGQAKRLVKGGGVSVDGERINDPFKMIDLKTGQILKVGKRKFIKLKKS